jgi:hypothetical protein
MEDGRRNKNLEILPTEVGGAGVPKEDQDLSGP